MNINKLYIKNFGKFEDRHFTFGDGINIIQGENESGKTTLHTFIRGIFFGIRKGRGRASKNDLYTRYEPWDNPEIYAGAVRFTCGDKVFRLSRSFQKLTPREELLCETDGEKMSVEKGDLKMLLGDISETVYENTVSVAQLSSRTDESLADELRNYIANYQGSSDGRLNLSDAQAVLREKKKQQESQNKQELLARDARKREMHAKITYLKEEADQLEENLGAQVLQQKRLLAARGANAKHSENGSDDAKKADDFSVLNEIGRNRYALICGALAILLALVGAMLLTSPAARIFCVLAAALGVAGFLWAIFHRQRTLNAQKQETEDAAASENEAQQKVSWSVEKLREELKEKNVKLENARSAFAQYCEEEGAPLAGEQEAEAIALAMQTITELSQDMQNKLGDMLKEKVSRILGELTNGKYTKLTMDDKLGVHVFTGTHTVDLEQLSRGTIEQIYFSLRMATNELLCSGEPMPILLDEVFAMYDEARLRQSLRWLADSGHQVLLFTCHRREQELLRDMEIPFEMVALD